MCAGAHRPQTEQSKPLPKEVDLSIMRPLHIVFFLLVASAATASSFTPLYVNPDGEPALTASLDAIYGPGGYSRLSDDLDTIWEGGALLSAVAISSHAGATQRFGVCVSCDGSDDIFFSPSLTADGIFSQILTANGQPSLLISAPFFRFFNEPSGHPAVGRVFSDPALNPLGADHMVSFAVHGRSRTFALGFEDWLFTSDPASDRDYNDLVVEVSFLTPGVLATPEPATALLVGCGLLLAVRLRPKRRND